MRPWSGFGAKSRPGPLQDARPNLRCTTLTTFWLENAAPGSLSSSPWGHKIYRKTSFWAHGAALTLQKSLVGALLEIGGNLGEINRCFYTKIVEF